MNFTTQNNAFISNNYSKNVESLLSYSKRYEPKAHNGLLKSQLVNKVSKRNVRFAEPLVTSVKYVPRPTPEEIDALHYTGEQLQSFLYEHMFNEGAIDECDREYTHDEESVCDEEESASVYDLFQKAIEDLSDSDSSEDEDDPY